MKHIFASLMILSSLGASAQKIDFNFSGQENKSTEEGFSSWAVGRSKTATKEFNGVTIKAEAVAGTAANGISLHRLKERLFIFSLRAYGHTVHYQRTICRKAYPHSLS